MPLIPKEKVHNKRYYKSYIREQGEAFMLLLDKKHQVNYPYEGLPKRHSLRVNIMNPIINGVLHSISTGGILLGDDFMNKFYVEETENASPLFRFGSVDAFQQWIADEEVQAALTILKM